MSEGVSLLTGRIKRSRLQTDLFFADGNATVANLRKLITVPVPVLEAVKQKRRRRFSCRISGCKLKFESEAAFLLHYNSMHRNVCSVCRHVLPTQRLLDLHLRETHDSYFKCMAEHEKMVCNNSLRFVCLLTYWSRMQYECFVEGCLRKFNNPHLRRLHLTDFHKFPRSFSLYRRRPAQTAAAAAAAAGDAMAAAPTRPERLPTRKERRAAARGATDAKAAAMPVDQAAPTEPTEPQHLRFAAPAAEAGAGPLVDSEMTEAVADLTAALSRVRFGKHNQRAFAASTTPAAAGPATRPAGTDTAAPRTDRPRRPRTQQQQRQEPQQQQQQQSARTGVESMEGVTSPLRATSATRAGQVQRRAPT